MQETSDHGSSLAVSAKRWATVSLTVGIVGLVIGCVLALLAAAPYSGMALAGILQQSGRAPFIITVAFVLAVAVIGIVAGVLALRRGARRGTAITGIIFSAVPLIPLVVCIAFWGRMVAIYAG